MTFRVRPWLALLPAALLAAGCGDLHNEVTIRADGSAHIVLVERIVDLPGLAERRDPGNRNNMADDVIRLRDHHTAARRAEIDDLLRRMGAAARLSSYVCTLYRRHTLLETATIDVNHIDRADFAPLLFMALPPPPAAAPDRTKRPPSAMRWADGTLTVENFWRGDFAAAVAGDWFGPKRQARARASLPFLRGRVMNIAIRAENGTVAETNARHVLADRTGVVLARIPLDRLLEALLDPEKRAELERIAAQDDPVEQLKAVERAIPGVLLDGAKTITVRFQFAQ